MVLKLTTVKTGFSGLIDVLLGGFIYLYPFPIIHKNIKGTSYFIQFIQMQECESIVRNCFSCCLTVLIMLKSN